MQDHALEQLLSGYLTADITASLDHAQMNEAIQKDFKDILAAFNNVNPIYFNNFITKFKKKIIEHLSRPSNIVTLEEKHILQLFRSKILNIQQVLEYLADKNDVEQSKNFIKQLTPYEQKEFFHALQWRLGQYARTQQISQDYSSLIYTILPRVGIAQVFTSSFSFTAALVLIMIAAGGSVPFPPFLIGIGICVGVGFLCILACKCLIHMVEKFSTDIPYAGTGTLKKNNERCEFLSKLNAETQDLQESQQNSTSQITSTLGATDNNNQVCLDDVETGKPSLDNNWNPLDANTLYLQPIRPNDECSSNGNNSLSIENGNNYWPGEYRGEHEGGYKGEYTLGQYP